MIGTILSIGGMFLVVYIFVKVIKMEKESKKRLKELEVIYTIGLKEYNKSLGNNINQSPSPITS